MRTSAPRRRTCEFVTVNTDPNALAQSAEAPVLQHDTARRAAQLAHGDRPAGARSTLSGRPTGCRSPCRRRPGWKRTTTSWISLTRRGTCGTRATPFADESATGSYSLLAGQHRPVGTGNRNVCRAAGDAVSDPSPSPQQSPRSGSADAACFIGLAVAAIVLITVLSDLPVSTSRASDIGAERSVMSEVNTDLAAVRLRHPAGHRDLEPAGDASADAGRTVLRRPDCSATTSRPARSPTRTSSTCPMCRCPQTTAGKQLGQMVATATLWTTSDALRAIEDVQTLMNNPNDAAALHSLVDRGVPTGRGSRQHVLSAGDRRRTGRSTPTCRPSISPWSPRAPPADRPRSGTRGATVLPTG